jgi:hypothetical protein
VCLCVEQQFSFIHAQFYPSYTHQKTLLGTICRISV